MRWSPGAKEPIRRWQRVEPGPRWCSPVPLDRIPLPGSLWNCCSAVVWIRIWYGLSSGRPAVRRLWFRRREKTRSRWRRVPTRAFAPIKFPTSRSTQTQFLLAQMEVPVRETETLIGRVRTRGGRCLLNLAPALPIDLRLLSAIDLLVANEGEVTKTGLDPPQLARRLRQGLVVTRGAAGAIAFLADGSRIEVPALPIEAVDTTGAGDTFVGGLAAALDLGSHLKSALRRASAAAGLACLGCGAQTAMPDRAAIDAAMAQLPSG